MATKLHTYWKPEVAGETDEETLLQQSLCLAALHNSSLYSQMQVFYKFK
jgi:hypothetical protein